MKKFFTIVPMQPKDDLKEYVYEAAGNKKLQMETQTRFPIMAVINGYAENEEIRLIAIVMDTPDCYNNFVLLQNEVDEFCKQKGVKCSIGIEKIIIPIDGMVATHMETFQKLINVVDDEDELFACTTYGTKPVSMVITMAIQYAYRIKENASISCIVYGQVNRNNGIVESAKIYDITALVQMDEIVRLLADQGVENPQKTIYRILSI